MLATFANTSIEGKTWVFEGWGEVVEPANASAENSRISSEGETRVPTTVSVSTREGVKYS